jgi:hypothetical protein
MTYSRRLAAILVLAGILYGCSNPDARVQGVLDIQPQDDRCVAEYYQQGVHGFAIAVGSPTNVAILGINGGTTPLKAVLEAGQGGPGLTVGGQTVTPQFPGVLRFRPQAKIAATNGLFAVADITSDGGEVSPVFIGLTAWTERNENGGEQDE